MSITIKTIKSLALLCTIALSQVVAADAPTIVDVKAMASPPGSKVSAGYMTVTNTGTEQLVITGARSELISRIELHESVIKDDVASMIKQEQVVVEPGKTVEFKHGGLHLMLMDLDSPLIAGSVLPITLMTNQGEFELTVPVVKPGKMAGMKHDGKMDHSKMKNDMGDKKMPANSNMNH